MARLCGENTGCGTYMKDLLVDHNIIWMINIERDKRLVKRRRHCERGMIIEGVRSSCGIGDKFDESERAAQASCGWTGGDVTSKVGIMCKDRLRKGG